MGSDELLWRLRTCAPPARVELPESEAAVPQAQPREHEARRWRRRWARVRRRIHAYEEDRGAAGGRGFAYVRCARPGAPIALHFARDSPWSGRISAPRFDDKLSASEWRAFRNLGGNALLLVPPRELQAAGLTDFAIDYDAEAWDELGESIMCAWPEGYEMFTHGHGEPYLHVRFEAVPLVGVQKALVVMTRALRRAAGLG